MASGSPEVKCGYGDLGAQQIGIGPFVGVLIQWLVCGLVQASQNERQSPFHVFVAPHQGRGQTEGGWHAEEPKQHGTFSLYLGMMDSSFDSTLDIVGVAQLQGHEPSKSPDWMHCRV